MKKPLLLAALAALAALALPIAVRLARRISFSKRVVLITGGSRGLGLVLARQLAAEGARLLLVARDAAELDRAARELRERGAKVQTFTGDVTDSEVAEQAVAAAIRAFGGSSEPEEQRNAGVNFARFSTVASPARRRSPHRTDQNMNASTSPQALAENLWFFPFPLKMLGADLRRNVTIVRLRSGKLIIHSTAPFAPDDIAAIRALGEPGWLLDGILRHDTFAREGRDAFPSIPYLAPEGFSESAGISTTPIVPAPDEWTGEMLALEIQGAPDARDTALLHIPSRTLILTELIFNFDDDQPLWTELLLRVAVGGEHHPGMTRPFKAGIKDETAFKASVDTILSWDFDRVIVGHGDVIESGGRAKLRAALQAAGF